MRRVLVDLAGAARAEDAVALATVLCELTGAELVVDAAQQADGEDLIVGERLPDEAMAAFALAPTGLAATPVHLQRVAVGADGSRESIRAVELAGELARRLPASLTILGIVEIAPDLAGEIDAAAEEQRIGRHLERALASVPADVFAESRLLIGVAAEALVDAAAEADLIVLGSRSQFGPEPRMRPGSVGAAVARRSPVPTVIATA